MKGGAGFFRRSELSTEETVQAAFETSSTILFADASSGRRGSVPSNLSFSPSNDDSRAVNSGRAPSAPLEPRVDRPVLDRDEGLDLALALADDPQRHRLDAAGGEAPPDLLPEKVRHLVADEPVDDSPRLLRVDASAVDLARLLHRREHGLLGDLVEADALEPRLARAGLEGLLEVPGDGLALAVGVGREIDVVGRLRGLLQLVDGLFFAGQHLVRGLVRVVAVDAEALARQIANVSVRGEDLEILAEELLERLRLGGRLDDDDGLSHAGRWTLS